MSTDSQPTGQPTPAGDHSACDFAYKQVTCDRCGRTYQCTPADDHYCAAEGDHCCQPCLTGGLPLRVDVVVAGGQDRKDGAE
jgi:hypothetical protein